jgi:hypothetical protein
MKITEILTEQGVSEDANLQKLTVRHPDQAYRMLGGRAPKGFAVDVLCPDRQAVDNIRGAIGRGYIIEPDNAIAGNGIGIQIISPFFEGGRAAQLAFEKLMATINENGGQFNRSTNVKIYSKKEGVAEASVQELNIQQLATISDEALDNAYGYGRSSPGNSFGWQANLMSAAYAKKMIDAGVTNIDQIADAIHKGWNVTARKFVQNPDQFDDTEKLRQAGKLDAKLQQRAKLMKIDYNQLDNEEQEKDRVVARALLQAIKGQQGVSEGQKR